MNPKTHKSRGLIWLLLLPLLFAAIYLAVEASVDIDPELREYSSLVLESNRVWSADGELLYSFGQERRRFVPLEQISHFLQDAVVQIEDRGFYSHSGISYWSMLRALLANISAGGYSQGASTISQQLARAIYLSPQKKLGRKASEIILARQLEKTLSKEQILEAYLNTIYWGGGTYGIEEAARRYFCIEPRHLSLSQSLFLAGIIKAPERFQPRTRPQAAQEAYQGAARRWARAKGLDIREVPPCPVFTSCEDFSFKMASHALARARAMATAILGRDVLETGGVDIRLTINASDQRALMAGIQEVVEEGVIMPGPLVLEKEPPEESHKRKCRLGPGRGVYLQIPHSMGEEQIFEASLGRQELKVDLRNLDIGSEELEGRWIKVAPREKVDLCDSWLTEPVQMFPEMAPQLAAVLVDSQGAIKAMAGGLGGGLDLDRVHDMGRPVASVIKPFVYLAAMDILGLELRDPIPRDLKFSYQGHKGRWLPKENKAHKLGPDSSLEDALVYSLNRPPVGLVNKIGIKNFKESLLAYGFPPRGARDLSVALGNLAMSPLEVASVYLPFIMHKNKAASVHLLSGLQLRDKEEVSLPEGVAVPLIEKDQLIQLQTALERAVRRGSGRAARLKGHVTAGKTGTSNDGRDSWFVGWTGGLLLVVWVGNDDFSPTPYSGPATAARIYSMIMSRVLENEATRR